MNNQQNTPTSLEDFIDKQQLPKQYLDTAKQWYSQLAQTIAQQHKQKTETYFVAINGCQGSGKSTLSEYLKILLKKSHSLSCAILSIDDFYLTRQERKALATTTHPLLQVRGVPGTHDIELLNQCLTSLSQNREYVSIPRFNKATDDRIPLAQWEKIEAPTDIIILEGWCMGAQPTTDDALITPCNSLELLKDKHGVWRTYVNEQLKKRYLPLFNQFDLWVMLQPPSFAQVHGWRLEQETKLSLQPNPQKKHNRIMTPEEIDRFVQHFQRVTTDCFNNLPKKTHFLYKLDANRRPTHLIHPLPLNTKVKFLT